MCEPQFILQRISVTKIILSNNVYDISIVCLLLRSPFESFIHGHFLSFFLFIFYLFIYLICSYFVVCCFVWFGLLVPLNEIKKYLA